MPNIRYVCLSGFPARIRMAAALAVALSHPLAAAVQRATFSNNNAYLVVDFLSDQVFHAELAAGAAPDPSTALYASPMIFKRDYAGPAAYDRQGDSIRTARTEVRVDTGTLCISISDRVRQALLTVVCPVDLSQPWKGLTIAKEQSQGVYGLGQQFKQLGSSDGNWLAHRYRDSGPFGNDFAGFGPAGMVGNVQIPVMYAVAKNANYALFLDNVYKQSWDFSGDPWKVHMFGDQIRFYAITGADLPDLRKTYMELVGTPPVPPRKALGLWVSEYGYRNWDQIEKLRAGLRKDHFPVDGFVLDLFWFGGVQANNDNSAMGNLDWDRNAFPDPEQHIAALRADNVGLITIEESYISKNTKTYAGLNPATRFLAYAPSGQQCNPANYKPITLSDWFGNGGMMDWSNPEAGAWIQNHRRLPDLISKGVLGHWTDLGEPEKYDPAACYQGVEATASGPKNHHADVHNLYSFLWNKSIYDGYFQARQQVAQRPFILTRSATAGVQRFGSGMWSGDIGSNLDLLATHANAQMHMSFSGIDYYGADTGGFRREGIPCNQGHSGNLQYQNELYTQWFANGSWFDVPVRPHTDNTQQNIKYNTAPDLVGVVDSNRENIRQRYELLPYYYSLAYRAYLYGEPVVPPPVFYYQNDPALRDMGNEKMIGRDLLVAIVAKHGEYTRDVYLPAGRWIDYHTNEWIESAGKWVRDYPEYLNGTFRLPAFARAGAILPMMYVDDQTKDVFGHRTDGTTRDELIVKVYAGETATAFTLYEDDGTTLSYDPDSERPVYTYRTTALSQQKQGTAVRVTIDSSQGTYNGAPAARDNVVRLIVQDAEGTAVTLNGQSLPRLKSKTEFEAASSGWYNEARNVIAARSGPRNVGDRKLFQFSLQPVAAAASVNFACSNGWTNPGEDVYVVGSTAALGNWDTSRAVKLSPSIYYEYIYNPPPQACGPGPSTPTWTGFVSMLPAGGTVEWKCVKKLNSGEWSYQPGENNRVVLTGAGFAGTSTGRF